MKILVSIDSESYTSVYSGVVANNYEAVTKLAQSASPDQKLEMEENKGKSLLRISFDDGEGHFIVGQVFDIPDSLPYVVVHHHAYDGVDFDIIGAAKTASYASLVKNAAVSAYKEECKYESLDFDSVEQTCFDTGQEWDVYTILDFTDDSKEVA